MSYLLVVKNITKTYRSPIGDIKVLDQITFGIENGEFLIIHGSSGSGKSTLLNIIGAFEKPTSGNIFFKERDVFLLDDGCISEIRNKEIGFVFQSFDLINRMTVRENVELPAIFLKLKERERREKSKLLLNRLGLSGKLDYKPYELSGGEQQRVAIARALMNNPSIILADEPTGNLDYERGIEICTILKETTKEFKTSVIMVTHNKELFSLADNTLDLNHFKTKQQNTEKLSCDF